MANYKEMLKNEIEVAMDTLAKKVGNLGMYVSDSDGSRQMNDEWEKVLDKAYELISDFATEKGFEV